MAGIDEEVKQTDGGWPNDSLIGGKCCKEPSDELLMVRRPLVMVWYGRVWYGMLWYGMVGEGLV